MRLGTILGRKAWDELNSAVRQERRAAEKRRREFYDKKKRSEALIDAGFVPLKTTQPGHSRYVAQ